MSRIDEGKLVTPHLDLICEVEMLFDLQLKSVEFFVCSCSQRRTACDMPYDPRIVNWFRKLR